MTIVVFSIMERKLNHWIFSLLPIGQYFSLSWRSIYFLPEGLFTLASSCFWYSAASGLIFRYFTNSGWFVSFNKGSTYVLKILFVLPSLQLYMVWKNMNANLTVTKNMKAFLYGFNWCSTSHNIVLIMHIHCMNSLFWFICDSQ